MSYGAAVLAAVLSGEGNEKVLDLVVVDVTPLSLGVETTGGFMDIMIPRNTPVPATKERMYSTSSDNQAEVRVKVYEGERTMTSLNNLLGQFLLEGIPPAPRGYPKITGRFDIDADGILTVLAKEESPGSKNMITVANIKGRFSKVEIERLVGEADRYNAADLEHKQKVKARNSFEEFTYDMRKRINDMGKKLTPYSKRKI